MDVKNINLKAMREWHTQRERERYKKCIHIIYFSNVKYILFYIYSYFLSIYKIDIT